MEVFASGQCLTAQWDIFIMHQKHMFFIDNYQNSWFVCCIWFFTSHQHLSVMPRSHIHGSPRRFYYGLNLTNDSGNANSRSPIRMHYIRMIKYYYTWLRMQYGKLRTNTDCHKWCRIVSVANPASSPWMCDLGINKGRVFLGWTSTKLGSMCLAQGHNAVTPMRLESAAPWSPVKHSTTESLHSLIKIIS